jgi:hypothetical protein
MEQARDTGRWLVIVSLSFVALTTGLAQDSTEPVPPPSKPLLVGAFIGRQEIGTLDILRTEDGYLVPLEQFAEMADCRVVHGEQEITLQTPMGPVPLLPEDLRESEGTLYLREEVIERKLAASVDFDRSSYSLSFDLPWRAREPGARETAFADLDPDVSAPSASLSTIHVDVRYNQYSDNGYFRGLTALGGALAGGYWRLGYEGQPGGQGYLRDYAWLYRGRQHLFLAGNQRVRIHPLLRGMELTGLQYAWTNQPLDLFSPGGTSQQLLSRQMQPISTFNGFGPPAGIAELWIDGMVVDREAIGLDGRYEFLDVSIPARQASNVEVRLYDRHSPGVPIEIIEETRTASAFLLPGGASMHMAGGGAAGNFLQNEFVDGFERMGPAGFYQTRHGLTDTLTLEGAVQGGEDVGQAFGGFVARLNRSFVMSFGLGGSTESAFGYSVELEGLPRPWRFLGRLKSSQAGFDPLYPFEQRDDYLEVGYVVNPKLDVAMIGRSRRNATDETDYVLPAIAWRPARPLWLSARPDIQGYYRLFLNYQIRRGSRLNMSSVRSRVYTQFWQDLSPRLRMTLNADTGGDVPTRLAALLTGYGHSRWRPTWTIGPMLTEGEFGALAAGRITLVPGIVAQARAETNALGGSESALQPRFMLNIVADFGLTGGRLVEAHTRHVREGRGGLAGVVHVDAPRGLGKFDLADLPVSIDGRRATRTNARGEFFIGELKPGVYQVEIAPDNLPIELSLRVKSVVAEVGGAAVTRVDFVARPEFGIAGRVSDATGKPVAGMPLELLDGARAVVARTLTDRFGLYRIDGLEIGTYLLRPRSTALPGLDLDSGSIVIPVVDDYLFGQDINLPVVVENEPADDSSSGRP